MVFWRNIIFFGVCVFSSLAMGKFKVGTRCEMEKKVMVEVPGENRKAELLFRLKFLPGEVIVPQATFRSSDQSLLRVFLQWKDAISTYGYINPKKCRTERWTEQKCIRHCNRDALYTKASACQTRYFKRYSKAKSPSEKTRIMDAMASRCNVPDAKFKTIHKKKTHCWHTGREKFYKFSSLHLNTISQEQNEKFWFPQKTSGLFELKPLGFLRSTHFVSLMLSQDQVHIGAHWKNGAQSSVLVTLDGVHSSIKKIAKTCFAETSRRFMNTSVRQKNSTAYGLLDYANVPNELPSKMRLGLQKKWKSMSLKDSQKLMIEISRHLRSQKKIVKKILKLMSKRVDYYYLDTQRKRKLVSRWSEKKKRNIKVYQYQTKKTVKKTKRKLVNLIKRYQTLFRSVNQLYAEILELRGTRDRKQKGVLAKLKQRKLTIEKSIETLEKVLIYQVDHEQKMTKSSVDSLNRKLKPHLNALLDFDVQIKSSEERALKNQEKIENLKEKLEEYNSWLKTQSKRASKERCCAGFARSSKAYCWWQCA